MCEICDLYNKPVSEYKVFNIAWKDKQLIAIWFQHRTKEQITLCHCHFPRAIRTLRIKAREAYGHNKIYIEPHEEDGHLHWVARENI
jgi:hypothetical protein